MSGVLADNLMGASHPYYPVGLKLPGYVPPLLPFKVVLAIFFSASAVLFLASWVLSGSIRVVALVTTAAPRLDEGDSLMVYRQAKTSSNG